MEFVKEKYHFMTEDNTKKSRYLSVGKEENQRRFSVNPKKHLSFRKRSERKLEQQIDKIEKD